MMNKMRPTIKITISGPICCGKSTLAQMIANILENDYNADVNLEENDISEVAMLKLLMNTKERLNQVISDHRPIIEIVTQTINMAYTEG